MTHYSGITTDLATRKATHKRTKEGFRNWKVANNGQPFPSREEAQDWEDEQPGEHHQGGKDADGDWYGYSFDYGVRLVIKT